MLWHKMVITDIYIVVDTPMYGFSAQLSNELSTMVAGTKINNRNNGFRVVDLCCGVGFSTRALRDAFPQPETTVIGVDTSPEMVRFLLNQLLLLYPCIQN